MLRVISEGYFNESRYAFLRNSQGHKVRRKALNLYLVKICFETSERYIVWLVHLRPGGHPMEATMFDQVLDVYF